MSDTPTFPNDRDCGHGNQRGKCHTCELEAELAAVTAERDDLRAEASLQQRADNAIAYKCTIESADFDENTITLKMLDESYVVQAGVHYLKKGDGEAGQ